MAHATAPLPAPAAVASPGPPPTFRGRIFRSSDGYKPRSLLELRIRAAIGAILNKRDWWRKWRHDDGAIRDKWLREFELGLITQTLESSARKWAIWAFGDMVLSRFEDFPQGGSEHEQRVFIEKVIGKTNYNLIWNEDSWAFFDVDDEEEDEDEEDENDQTETEEEFTEGNERMESYGQIVWYYGLEDLKKRLRELPLDSWPLPLEFDVGIDQSLERAAAFLIAVRKGEVTDTNFHEFLPDGDRSPATVSAVQTHVFRIVQELNEIRQCIVKTLENVIAENNLDANEEGPFQFVSPGPVQETWMSDQLIGDELKRNFVSQVAQLENVPDTDKDWHPGSDDQVLDLVHPSLYCCVFGTTKQLPSSAIESINAVKDANEWMQSVAFAATDPVENPHHGTAEYQWIPSEFRVEDDGRVRIMSYINNVHPVKQGAMYETIASIFMAFVPMFDRVLSSLLTEKGPKPIMEIPNLYERDVHEIPMHPKIPALFPLEPQGKPFTLRGRTVQVIVKIAEIHLTPEKPSYPGGSWHVEGSDAEQIVATGIYYFGCENITESKLAFRVIVKEPNYQQHDVLGMRAMYGLAHEERLVQDLGAVVAHEDRCVVFPNTLQHHVDPFELDDKTKPGVRKIMAFFLVDPCKNIPSTYTIPPQQEDWLLDTRKQTLVKLPNLPDIIRQTTMTELLGGGMTLEHAKEHRIRLMAERKPPVDDSEEENLDRELFFSLCEH